MPRSPDQTIKDLQRRCLPAEPTPPIPFHHTNAYVPSLAERIDLDPNLTDGARRCARILAAYTHRRARENRSAAITVTWIAARMDVCRRTVQRYLRQLERAGYITVTICQSRARMCIGIIVEILDALMPGHGWPVTQANPAATQKSQNYKFRYKYRRFSCSHWTAHMQEGLFRSLMNKIPPPPALL